MLGSWQLGRALWRAALRALRARVCFAGSEARVPRVRLLLCCALARTGHLSRTAALSRCRWIDGNVCDIVPSPLAPADFNVRGVRHV